MYQVTFIDSTEFTGGEPESSMWDMLPKKPIKSIVYWLHENEKYELSNFEEYCSCIERAVVVNPNGKETGRPIERVTKAIIMGRIKERVYQVVFDLKRGTVYRLVTPWGQEYSNQEQVGQNGEFLRYVNGKPLSGWLQGILNADYPGPKLKRLEHDPAYGEDNAHQPKTD